MRYPLKFKRKALVLRKKGYSISEIASKMKISKSTTSLWVRNIILDENAQKRLKQRKILGQYKTSKIFAQKRKDRDRKYNIWARSTLSLFNISKTTSQILCAVLYWAEGGKFSDNRLEFTNSDPRMISVFMSLLEKGFKVDKKKYKANIHIHDYHNDKTQKKYWSSITKLKIGQFNKSYRKSNTKTRIRENYPGCVRICYYDANVARKIKALYENLIDFL